MGEWGVDQQDHGKKHGNVDLTALYGQRNGKCNGDIMGFNQERKET